jgi:chemotaxis protein MotB
MMLQARSFAHLSRVRPTHVLSLAALCAMPLLVGGCVQQEKYDSLLMSNRSLQEQVVSLEDERDAAKANLDTVRAQLASATTDLEAIRKKFNLTEEEMQKLVSDYDTLMKRLVDLDFGPLPPDVSSALEELASQYPNVLTFDAKRSMLRFASDFTFALGSADLTSDASNTVAQLAKILNTPTASTFEARIIGHTDNVPISKPETRRLHPTNWHLSAHRAISVGSALISDGVSAERIQVAGYGEYRPVVANPDKGGAAQNRRVEIFLVPMRDVTPSEAPASASRQPRETDEPMK